MKRRHFLQISGTAAGGLLVSGHSAWTMKDTQNGPFAPNMFLEISPDNWTTFTITKQEIGQGSTTGISQIIAEELGVDWKKIKIKYADGDAKYGRYQDTGGSNSILELWQPLREAAATTRQVLIKAAAKKWQQPEDQLDTRDSFVLGPGGEKKIAFGELLDLASRIPAPANIQYRKPADYQFIGKPIIGHRVKDIVKGQLPYGLNVKVPDMTYAVIERAPIFGSSIASFDDSMAREVPGVIDIIQLEGNAQEPNVFLGGVRAGIAVIAENTWAALQGKAALKITWSVGDAVPKDSKALKAEFEELYQKERKTTYESGEATASSSVTKTITATYENPYQVNACMEPLNATAHFKEDSCEIWAGTQSPQMTRSRIAAILEIEERQVTVHHHPAGGGFGRRYYTDFIEEAALLSRATGKPVQLIWTREDTIKTSRYHPFRMDYYRADLNERDEVVNINFSTSLSQPGGYRPFPYDLPAVSFSPLRPESPTLPFTSWRSVIAHIWGFGLESFIDELAAEVKQDPLEFRLQLLGNNRVIAQKGPWTKDDLQVDRLKNTLTLAAEKAEWGKSLPENWGQGLSTFHYNTSYCSQVAEVSVIDGKLKIHKVVCVLDCGQVINPSLVKGQIEGSVVWALTALMKSNIELENGKVKESNFHDYPMLRMDETPEIEVHLVETDAAPGGSGEQAVPGLAPAVLNAIYAATGKRVRKIPVRPEDLV